MRRGGSSRAHPAFPPAPPMALSPGRRRGAKTDGAPERRRWLRAEDGKAGRAWHHRSRGPTRRSRPDSDRTPTRALRLSGAAASRRPIGDPSSFGARSRCDVFVRQLLHENVRSSIREAGRRTSRAPQDLGKGARGGFRTGGRSSSEPRAGEPRAGEPKDREPSRAKIGTCIEGRACLVSTALCRARPWRRPGSDLVVEGPTLHALNLWQ